MTTILHIEDDPLWIEIAQHAIETLADTAYLGACISGSDALRYCKETKPDVVLLDLGLPDVDGFKLAKELHDVTGSSRILIVTSWTDEATFFHLIRSPDIWGMIWKAPKFRNHLAHALTALNSGHRYFDPAVMHALKQFRGATDAFIKILSERELSLLTFFGEGCSDREIGAIVGISHATAHSHRHRIMQKLNLRRTAELIKWTGQRVCPDTVYIFRLKAVKKRIWSSHDFQLIS